MNYIATLTLSQNGRQGPVEINVDYEGNLDNEAEAHVCMKHLEELWDEMKDHMDPSEVSKDDTKYSASLMLSQTDVGSDVFTKLEMYPRLSMNDDGPVPSSYEAICFIAQVWLQMCGVIDAEGNVLDESAVEKSMDLKVTQSPTVH